MQQGDYLPGCWVPIVPKDFGKSDAASIRADEVDLIVLTQSCDLATHAVDLVAASPVFSVAEYAQAHRDWDKAKWGNARKGRIEGLIILPAPLGAENWADCLVVDFHEVYSLPLDTLAARANDIGSRWRLVSPYLEHLSQSLGHFFMRVAVPDELPAIRDWPPHRHP